MVCFPKKITNRYLSGLVSSSPVSSDGNYFPSEESLRMAVAVELAALVLLFMLGRVKGKRVETRPETEEEKNARWKAQRSQAGSLWIITFTASLAAVYFIYFR